MVVKESSRPGFSVPLVVLSLNSLQERIEALVAQYQKKTNETLIQEARGLIENLQQLQDQPLEVRKGLCTLLKINVPKLQQEILVHLKKHLNSYCFLGWDVEHRAFSHLVDMEKQLSLLLYQHVCIDSISVLTCLFLEVYLAHLIQLWLVALMTEDRNIERFMQENRAIEWIQVLLRRDSLPSEISAEIKNIQKVLGCLEKPFAYSTDPQVLEIKNHLRDLATLFYIGKFFQKVGVLPLAIRFYEKNLERLSQNRDEEQLSLEGNIQLELGEVFLLTGAYDSGRDQFDGALTTARKIPSRSMEALAIFGKGKYCYYRGKASDAIMCWEESLKIAKELGDQELVIKHLINIGVAYQHSRNDAEAMSHYDQALVLAQSIGSKLQAGKVYINKGTLFQLQSNWKEAKECNEKALPIMQELKERNMEGKIYNGLGLACRHLEDPQKAFECFEKGVAIAQETYDLRYEADLYRNMGAVCNDMGKTREAVKYLNKSLPIALKLQDLRGQATTYRALGIAYKNQGMYRQTVECQEKGLQITTGTEDNQGKSEAYLELGEAFHRLGIYSKALDWHSKALAAAQRDKNQLLELQALTNLGNVYLSQENFDEAKRHYEQALGIAEKLGDPGPIGRAHGNIGNVCFSQGQFKEAFEKQKKAEEIVRGIGDELFLG